MKPNERLRQWLVAARLIDRRYAGSGDTAEEDDAASNPEGPDLARAFERAMACRQQMKVASDRGWPIAWRCACEDYQYQLRILLHVAKTELDEWSDRSDQLPIRVSRADLIRDLLALDKEFTSATFDVKHQLLSVVTNDIELDGIAFGPFEIVLHFETPSASRQPWYEVVSLTGNYAEPNSDVTHPHVTGNQLCEGEAQPTIKLALAQGRLLDFFQIVQQVLLNYNPDSAYVTTHDWFGSRCSNCDFVMNDDDRLRCAGCEACLCDECVYSCQECGSSFCSDCDTGCGDCNQSVCQSCLCSCEDCESSFCSACLVESGRCHECEKSATERSDDGSTGVGCPCAEVHADGVGQVVVPA